MVKPGIRGQSSRSPGFGFQGSRPNRDNSRGANPRYSLEQTVRRLGISDAAKRVLLDSCLKWDCR
eukprot:12417269-Karenia_brevis.AAC.1